jgi:pimeloyl-ACP methyl ester carboxylesterase
VAASPSSSIDVDQFVENQTLGFVVAPDGIRIAYQRFGDGPPLVLVHGSLDDHRLWMQLSPVLGERFTVYALDRRGRGASGDSDPSAYAIEREFEDVAAIVESIDEPAVVLGHSYGALCALEAALRTDRVEKLVLYEPPLSLPSGPAIVAPERLAVIYALLDACSWEEAVLAFMREIVRLPDEEISAVRDSPAWPAALALAPTLAREIRAVEHHTFDAAKFRRMTTPTLMLAGSESAPFLQAATAEVVKYLPNCRTVRLPQQGHLAMYTAPELFLHEVFDFLRYG